MRGKSLMTAALDANPSATPARPRRAEMLAAWGGFSAAAWLVLLYFAIARGQDFNWDQRNYHLGVPFLLQHGRFWQSIEPAGIQSYFNPPVLQVQFWLLCHVGAVTAAAILGSVQSLAFMVAGALCFSVAAGLGAGIGAALLGAGLSLLSPVALSEAGGTYIDLVTAIPVLGAYALLLTRGRGVRGLAAGVGAGSLLGVATGLKLTNALFVLGVAGFALAGADTVRERARWLLACGAAAALALMVVSGDWYLQVWRHLGNPLFPFYNGVFHSPDAIGEGSLVAGGTWRDERFLPRSVLALWRYPLYWLLGGSPNPALKSPSAEVAFIDPRWVAVVAGLTLFLATLAVARRWRACRLAEPQTGLLFAFALAYGAWLFQFDIQRYAVVLELLCGPVLLVLWRALRRGAARQGGLGATLAASALLMAVPDWGHVPWHARWQPIGQALASVQPGAIVFVTGRPSLIAAVGLPADVRYVGLGGGLEMSAAANTRLVRQLKADLAQTPPPPLLELDRGTVEPVTVATLASYGLVVRAQCQPFVVGADAFRLCGVGRMVAEKDQPAGP